MDLHEFEYASEPCPCTDCRYAAMCRPQRLARERFSMYLHGDPDPRTVCGGLDSSFDYGCTPGTFLSANRNAACKRVDRCRYAWSATGENHFL